MLTVIFGAGASHDSKPLDFPQPIKRVTTDANNKEAVPLKAPPLTSQILAGEEAGDAYNSNVMMPKKLDPVLQTLIRRADSLGLEGALQELRDQSVDDPERWVQLMAFQRWLYDIIDGSIQPWLSALNYQTTYTDLVERLRHLSTVHSFDVNYISFNYDTMLEQAIEAGRERSGSRFEQLEAYVTAAPLVFKPHGSTSWSYATEISQASSSAGLEFWSRERLKNAKLQHDKEARSWRGSLLFGKTLATHPALSIPVLNKSDNDFVFPVMHLRAMEDALSKTSALLIVGWSAKEPHFLAKLQEFLPEGCRMLIVCGDGGLSTIDELRGKVGAHHQAEDSDLGFAEFLSITNELERWVTKSVNRDSD